MDGIQKLLWSSIWNSDRGKKIGSIQLRFAAFTCTKTFYTNFNTTTFVCIRSYEYFKQSNGQWQMQLQCYNCTGGRLLPLTPVPAVNHVTIQCQCERLQAAPTHDSGDIELVIAVPGHWTACQDWLWLIVLRLEAGSCGDVTSHQLVTRAGDLWPLGPGWRLHSAHQRSGCCDHRTSATPRQGVLELAMEFREISTPFTLKNQ